MGGKVSKKRRYFCDREFRCLKERVKILQEEMKQMVYEREKESMSYERDMMLFSFKEADWKQERKRLREEVRNLRKVLQEKEDQIREIKELGKDNDISDSNHKELELIGTKLLVQKMKEERVWRDEAVEKWKQLYLAIKTELDDLIQRTYGDGLLRKAEEDEIQMENLKRELQERDETIQALKAHLASMERKKNRTETEFDMLRQSLKIMNGSSMISIPVKERLFKTKCGR
ncbi:uncharacterized protein PF11_0207-like isoform X2 [Neltuma alba]|uniref:uncharacterized protein PF11_0207 isoform X2 n=1 Tax=Neltuma alba TaxID=207710 RepID=UPI0010A38D7E|nr:uncharacterized protein PF11_0207-like isoform X2 [Prosopis alba]XP_028793294.1 uncharacterized protein PF11_0207-like isoform X2 [Prosopis alba]